MKSFRFLDVEHTKIRCLGHLGYCGSQEEYVGQIGSIQFVDVGISTDEDSSAVVLFAQLVVSFAWVGHTRFSKPAKHVFLQLVCGHKLSRIQKSCISSVQLKRRASLSAYTLRMAFQNALLHTRVVSSILASLILCFIVF